MSAWGEVEKKKWLSEQTWKRSYGDEVVSRIERLNDRFTVTTYGALPLDPAKYPLYLIRSKTFDPKKKIVLITGGVHGYETSGVHGALRFMDKHAAAFEGSFNFLCTPCISPWGYETINRWNHLAIDPNRSFCANSSADESRLFLEAMAPYQHEIYAHFDLHETTDSDNTTFRPALAQRDGKTSTLTDIPDGFYVVGDTSRPERDFQKAIIDAVKKVTHIAPPDSAGMIIGVPLDQEGVIFYDKKKLFLCGGFSDAKFTTTTEVYPDSPSATDEICIEAQVAAIVGGLTYLGQR